MLEKALKGIQSPGIDLSNKNLSWADMSCSYLKGANLKNADLSCANLSNSNLSYADLTGANLTGAKLYQTDLSQTKGLVDPEEWLFEHFNSNSEGLIVYARFCEKLQRRLAAKHPEHWKFEEGECLSDILNSDRCTQWGSGIMFGTKEWWQNHWATDQLWKCCIPWMAVSGICVPYSTKFDVDTHEGFARCSRLILLSRESVTRKMFYKDE